MSNNDAIQSIYKLSPLQNGMLYNLLLGKDSRAFFEQLAFDINGDFDLRLFESSFKIIVQRYDIFRTLFFYKDIALPRQVVLKARDVNVSFIDISSFSEDKITEFIGQYKKKDIENGFDITKDILIRISILQIGSRSFKLIISFHHIIMDGWSFSIVINELFNIYKCIKENKPLELGPVQPYRYFIDWIENQDKDKAALFWKKYLKGFTEQTSIVGNNQEQTGGQQDFLFELEESLKASLIALAKKLRVTLNTIFETAWGILLQRYNNVNDVVFGKVVSGRGTDMELLHSDASYLKVVGLCINTIPVRVNCEEESSFSQLVKKLQNAALSLEKYSYFPLMEIQFNTALKKNLFDHIIVFENYPVEKYVEDLITGRSPSDFTISNMQLFESVDFNIYISVMVSTKIVMKVVYKTDLYDENSIARLLGQYKEIFKRVIANPNILINQIEILTETEKKKILCEFNNYRLEYNRDKIIHELFEEQVAKSPNHIAVFYNNKAFTYAEINAKANQLARTLKEKGVQPDEIVGIMVEHSYKTIIGIFSILKAGGAYLPVDPEYPSERIHYMLKDCASRIILTEKNFTGKVNFSGEIIYLDDQANYQSDNTNLKTITKSSDLMYVTYTSGSTGKPKGVMIEHRNAIAYINAFFKEFNINCTDAVLQLSSYCFDIFVEEVFPVLLYGGKLVIPTKHEMRNFNFLSGLIKQYQVSIISSTPQILSELSNYYSLLNSVRIFISGGDVLKPEHIANLLKNAKVYNTYGPTETTICASYYNCPKEIKYNIPIGKPIHNYGIYILDKECALAPIGVIGEIFIAGDGVGRGYLNQPELTAEKFIPIPSFPLSPFPFPFSRMYRTGDLGRWLPDGNIEFVGRNDNQVKIRGIRVELGEIERYLSSYELINEAVVLLQENENKTKYLHAYIVSDPEITITELNQYLSLKLPNYMTPSKYTLISKIPLTLHGKIDYTALMELRQDSDIKRNYEAPVNIIEIKLAQILSEALKQKISINDNFFDFGGDSLTIIKIMPDLYNEGINLSIQDFYQYPTIKKLAHKILNASTVDGARVSAIEDNSKYNTIARVPNIHKDEIIVNNEKVSFSNILLTGATGFLGIHILDELLRTTLSKIFCLVRGKNETDAAKRLSKLLQVYHGDKYNDLIAKRIILINGDLSLDNFGLSEKKYMELGNKIELVIHAAALVKYFGKDEEFEEINVSGTNRIIDFSNKFHKKVAYISTTSISGNGLKQEKKDLLFTENDFFIGQNYMDNVYIKSKFEAESLVLKSMATGLDATVFRVGNLTGRYTDGQFQFNIDENMFYILIKTIIKTKYFPDILLECNIEFTPVDYCSKAIVELLKTPECGGKVFHIFNHKTIKVDEILKTIKPLGINIDVIEDFSTDNYLTKYNYNILTDENYRVNISSQITCGYLKQLGFDWPEVNKEYTRKIVKHINNVDFLKGNPII